VKNGHVTTKQAYLTWQEIKGTVIGTMHTVSITERLNSYSVAMLVGNASVRLAPARHTYSLIETMSPDIEWVKQDKGK
jgi:hypothetical protein